MKIYTFKIQLRWQRPVSRTIEIGEDETLHDLHCAIQSAFGWDNDHLYSFFLSGRTWDRQSEYAGKPMPGILQLNQKRPAEGTALGELDYRSTKNFSTCLIMGTCGNILLKL